MRADRGLIGLGCSFRNPTTDFFYFVNLKTNNSTRHNREILSNQYSIRRLFFAELSLSVSLLRWGMQVLKPSNLNSLGTEVADPLRLLKEWDLVYILPTGVEHIPQRRLGSAIQLVSCDSLRARIAYQFQ